MDLNCRIQRHTGLTQTERHLRDYILRYPEKVAQMNARELAQASFTSPSAVIRFCQKFGYKGLKDFKADLLCAPGGQGEGETPDCNFPFGADTPFDQVTDAVLKVERESLRRLRATLDGQEVARAVDMLLKAGCIDLCAIGTSGYVSADFAFRMMKFGRRVNTISDRVELSYAIQQMDKTHCLLVVSYSGANEQVRISLRAAREHGVPVIAVTARPDSIAGMQADCVLALPPLEANDEKISTFASAAAEKAVLDVLFAHIFQQDYDRNAAFVRSDARRLQDVRVKP